VLPGARPARLGFNAHVRGGRISLSLAAACAVAAVAPAAEAATYRIGIDRQGFVNRLGPLRPHSHPYPRDARAALGTPSSQKAGRGVCRLRWSRLKLSALFTSFGGISDFCRDGLFQSAVVRSRIWRTWEGLRVGMRSSRVPELHRGARFERGKWVLASQTVFGSEPAPTVSALVRRGRVTALSLFIGSAGD
jgi:hypothetical protein